MAKQLHTTIVRDDGTAYTSPLTCPHCEKPATVWAERMHPHGEVDGCNHALCDECAKRPEYIPIQRRQNIT